MQKISHFWAKMKEDPKCQLGRFCPEPFNYLSCLKPVNLYLGADVTFFAASEVTFLKQAAKRILAKPPARKLPINVAILFAIFKLLDFRSPLHVCMWAVFLVAFFSLLRKSNLVPTSLADATSGSAPHLRLCDVTFAQDHCTLLVHKTKTIQFGQRALQIVLPLIPNSVLCPFSALQRLLNISHQNSGAPFFMFPTPVGLKPVTGHHFTKFLKSCIVNIGLDPTQYSPHSFRRGVLHLPTLLVPRLCLLSSLGIGHLMPT